ncbi:unnamed protein product [Candida verbasci]|uniref:Plus3 domain-containing protein n=1 Tax=Candida verbasci TaxID=1227364 RepID=A0A9W4U033_9ASCO|nr:unnamed protein product [Candida verbasci]
MSDLEEDLLALAGGDDYEPDQGDDDEIEVSTSKRKSNYDEDEDEDEDDDQVLSKRRKLEEDNESDDYAPEDIEEDELINPYPLEGKYKNEEDRYLLESMDEIKKEGILYERSQEMERYNEKKYLKERMKRDRMMKNQQLKKPELPSKPTRSSGRSKTSTKADVRNDKLNELKKQREQANRRKTRRSKDDYEEESDVDELPDEDDEEMVTDESDYDDGIVTWGGKSKIPSRRSREPSTLEDINKLRVGRTVLAKYCFHPKFFDLLIDTFGRINLGIDKKTKKPLYRMVKIINIELKPERAYRIANNSNKTDLYIWVSQNRNQKKLFPINIFSDSPISKDEFERYLKELSKTNERIDYKEDVEERFENIKEFFEKGLSDQDINEMIERKRKIQQQKGDYKIYEAVKLNAQLNDEYKIFKQQGNLIEAKKTLDKLKEIEQVLKKYQIKNSNSKQLDVMTKVNQRNRKLNNEIIRKAEIKSHSIDSKDLDNGGDPFSRLKTTTRMFYQDLIDEQNKKAMKDLNIQEEINKKAKQEKIIAKSTYRDLGEMDKLIKTIEFDIELVL